MIACFQGDSSEANIIRLLVQHGANPTLRNHDNKTATDLCHDSEMASWIKTATAPPSQTLP